MLTFVFQHGFYRILRDGVSLGQGTTMEKALLNALGDTEFREGDVFGAAEVLTVLMGDVRETHGQIVTREP
jgi:hypothetical protein